MFYGSYAAFDYKRRFTDSSGERRKEENQAIKPRPIRNQCLGYAALKKKGWIPEKYKYSDFYRVFGLNALVWVNAIIILSSSVCTFLTVFHSFFAVIDAFFQLVLHRSVKLNTVMHCDLDCGGKVQAMLCMYEWSIYYGHMHMYVSIPWLTHCYSPSFSVLELA